MLVVNPYSWYFNSPAAWSFWIGPGLWTDLFVGRPLRALFGLGW